DYHCGADHGTGSRFVF
nr:immunoglobulin light chain junction region [Macaca mulatta]MOV97045.1 immunoglobulin light chain junction region [Macaca mulatta]MOV98938.1 immunoglobulin light chain junction region [Macaca mulatta]MOV99203.1 immunoglobulin light chain junction region [Macaca mulatta]